MEGNIMINAIASAIAQECVNYHDDFNCTVTHEGISYDVSGRYALDGYTEYSTGAYICTDAIVSIEELNAYDEEGNEVPITFSVMILEDMIEDELIK